VALILIAGFAATYDQSAGVRRAHEPDLARSSAELPALWKSLWASGQVVSGV
jgi:hypothetical protein